MKRSIRLLLLVIVGCNQEPISLPSSDDLGVSVRNGRLVFESLATFTQVVNSLGSRSEDELTSWESRFEGFSSLRTKQGTTVGGSLHPQAMKTIANEEGLYQVGENVILVGYEAEYLIRAADEDQVRQLVQKKENAQGVKIHRIRRVGISRKPTTGDQLAGLGANYQLEMKYNCSWVPDGCGLGPPAEMRKFVFESYAAEYALTIIIGVRLKFEYRDVQALPFGCYVYLDWEPSNATVHRKMTSIKFSGHIYNPTFELWASTPQTVEATIGSNLVLEKYVTASCIDNFKIQGTLLENISGTYCPSNSYEVNGGNPTGNLWTEIRFCRAGYSVPGGGGGGGEGGGEGGPPEGGCQNGCVWSGFECVCP